MPLAESIEPWTGDVYRHIPDGSPFEVTDFRFAGQSPNNRWNDAGEPTLYLASDAGLAIAEFARHLARDYAPNLFLVPLRRRVYRLRVRLEQVLDLRDPDVWRALGGLTDAPTCFLNRDVARATARFVRATTPAQAIKVPSIAFLDDLSRWTLVVFLDRVEANRLIVDVADVGVVSVEASTKSS